MTVSLGPLLQEWLGRSKSRVVDGIGPDLSGDDVVAMARRIAEDLNARGVRANEPVHVATGNRAADLGALLGIWSAQAVAVPIHRSAAPSTREALARATRSRLLVDGDIAHGLADEPPPARALLKDAALVVFTSGSTGLPKGVVIGHDALARKLAILDRLLALRPDDVVVVPLHLNFIFGIWISLLAVRSGAKLRLVQKFTTTVISDLLGSEMTVLAAVPTMLRTLLAEGVPTAPRLRAVLTGGEALAVGLSEALEAGWPQAEIFDLYGSTETTSCDFCRSSREKAGAGSIGFPTETVSFRIAREDRTVAQAGEMGELQIRTGCEMLGYLDDPALTKASFIDGYFRTGDLAHVRPDGRTMLIGRTKEIISRGGNKISPLEIEGLLCRHDHIAAALCAGVPDIRFGQAIHAVVVLKHGSALTADELKRWVAERTDRFKVPDVVIFSDLLPLGATGKASRAMIALMSAPPDPAAARA